MSLRSVRTASVQGRRVLVRVDYNIEFTLQGQPRDTTRIDASLPTIRWLLQHGAAVLLLAHRGRPTRRTPALSIRKIVPVLKRRLRRPVVWLNAPLRSAKLRAAVRRLKPGQVALLENIRFDAGEEINAAACVRALRAMGDMYVNDAFSVSHRSSASIVGLAKRLPSYAGLGLETEVTTLARVMKKPLRPYIAVIGGAKISTKIGLLKNLLRQADHVLLGGALANTVLQAEGLAIGQSLSEPAMIKATRGLTVKNPHLHIPCDVRVQAPGQLPAVRPVGRIGADERIVDIGPDTVSLFKNVLAKASTVVWNGPMGVYEQPPFDAGTKAIARLIARSSATSVAGGGETVDAIRSQKLQNRFTFISTGGGAMLEFLEGRRLPGLHVLSS